MRHDSLLSERPEVFIVVTALNQEIIGRDHLRPGVAP
jgi:hypothetical protein